MIDDFVDKYIPMRPDPCKIRLPPRPECHHVPSYKPKSTIESWNENKKSKFCSEVKTETSKTYPQVIIKVLSKP